MLLFPKVKLCCAALRCAALSFGTFTSVLSSMQGCVGATSCFLLSTANHSIQHLIVPAVNNVNAGGAVLTALHPADSVLLLLTGDLWKGTVWTSVDGRRTCRRDWWEEPDKPKSNGCLMTPLVFSFFL